MAVNWLIVNEWAKGAERKPAPRWDLTKRVEAQGSRARKLGAEYEQKLNNGIDDVIKHHAETGETVWTVCSIPWNNVRDYRNDIVEQIEEAPIYEG